ncbi:PucR family transcriptional regulator [Streptomyces thermolineatus]|uniref:PucR family transcriptional regulator n=1 Tax=Streptomyces thermolineatus TaxID=44033 RepID=A0ABN3KTF4_9ACTN
MPAYDTGPVLPAVSLRELVGRSDLGLRQVGGPRRDVAISLVHTSEMDDPLPYLLGGELILSAGVRFPGPDGSDAAPHGDLRGGAGGGAGDASGGASPPWDRYVARAVEGGAAALGFGLAPVHDETPRSLVEACDRHGLPLLEVPRGTRFASVERAVWQALTEARHRELRRVAEAQASLATAAARPDPVPAVLRQTARRLDAWAVLLDADGAELHAAGRRPPAAAREALVSLAAALGPRRTGPVPGTLPGAGAGAGPSAAAAHGAGAGSRTGSRTGHGPGTGAGPGAAAGADAGAAPLSASGTAAGLQLAVYALPGPVSGRARPALGVVSRRREPADGTIAGVAAVLLSLLTGPRHRAAGLPARSALVRLLLGGPPEDAAALLHPGRWQVVRARRRGPHRPYGTGTGTGTGTAAAPPGTPTSTPGPPAADALAADALGDALGTALVDRTGDGGVRALLPEEGAGAAVAELPGWTIGVSAPAGPADLAAADLQAERALRRAVADRRPLVRHRPQDAGLTALLPAEEAAAAAAGLLAPLAGAPSLLETLRTWLSLHGSWDRTAVALGVHRNTVRKRIARTGELLDADLNDADVRTELWLALRCLPAQPPPHPR